VRVIENQHIALLHCVSRLTFGLVAGHTFVGHSWQCVMKYGDRINVLHILPLD